MELMDIVVSLVNAFPTVLTIVVWVVAAGLLVYLILTVVFDIKEKRSLNEN